MSDNQVARVLTIAGSDSGGGAGIEADLKTFTALGVYGMAAVTSITAQNTTGVFEVHDAPPELVRRQIDVVVEDIGVDAAKTGMLSNKDIIEAVANSLQRNRIEKLVVDPVMVSKSGHPLLQNNARETFVRRLIPLALILTPNKPEAQFLAGMSIQDEQDVRRAAEIIFDLGAKNVLIKGGHFSSPDAIDYLFDGANFRALAGPRFTTRSTHGTGCTFSAATAAYLAKGLGVEAAVYYAKSYVSQCIRHALDLGKGYGPLNHFWPLAGIRSTRTMEKPDRI